MHWVLGFAFDSFGRVALILKKPGPSLENCWNGLGGKIEGSETAVQAMRREFREESGVDIEENCWQLLGSMCGKNWNVTMFTVVHPAVQFAVTKTDEKVRLFAPWNLHIERCGDNVRSLIGLAQLPAGNRPLVKLLYND